MTDFHKRNTALIIFLLVCILSVTGVSVSLLIPVPEKTHSEQKGTEDRSPEFDGDLSGFTGTHTESFKETDGDASGDGFLALPAVESPQSSIQIPDEIHPTANNIWIGDSRMVGIANSGITDRSVNFFIAKGAMYYVWFRDYAVPYLKKYLDTGRVFNVIIQMGINDCANNAVGYRDYTVNHYISAINSLSSTYPNAVFYFISVGYDVGNFGGAYGRKISAEEINPYVTEFNAAMKSRCVARYLPVGEAIKAEGMGYSDGVHYSLATNRWIYSYVLNCILNGVPEENGPEESETEEVESEPSGSDIDESDFSETDATETEETGSSDPDPETIRSSDSEIIRSSDPEDSENIP